MVVELKRLRRGSLQCICFFVLIAGCGVKPSASQQGIVDRWEGNYVVIEIGETLFDVPRSQVAEGIEEGDVVVLQDGRWIKMPSATTQRGREMSQWMDKLFESGR